MIRNEMVMSDSSRNSRSGEALIAATAAGAAAIGAVGAGAVCGVPAFSETVPVALAADLPGCSTEARDSVIAAGVSGWGSQASGWLSFCSKTTRAAAWAGLSLAWTEMELTPRTTHRPKKILIFIKLSIFQVFLNRLVSNILALIAVQSAIGQS